ncbi:hypothetical protein B0O99DRAFT_686568 [Bisporella sp. PMI_857]|nr:hypothetical protein B0O99DRAFT_686568 [Bisporella sp. PMI_857]
MHFTKICLSILTLTSTMISSISASPITVNSNIGAGNEPVAATLSEYLDSSNFTHGLIHSRLPAPPAICDQVEGEYCEADDVTKGIKFLLEKGVDRKDCDCGPKFCRRLTCNDGASIFVCNNNDYGIGVSCRTASDYAQDINDRCRRRMNGKDWVKGQYFDTAGWNVVVRDDKC